MAEFFQSMPGVVFCFFLALPALFIVVPLAVGMRDAKALKSVSEKRANFISEAQAGMVSLEGVATESRRGLVKAGLTRKLCCWFYAKVEKYENHGSEEAGWVVVQEDWSYCPFLLTDATGVCVIRPEFATVTAAHRNLWYGTTPEPKIRVRQKAAI